MEVLKEHILEACACMKDAKEEAKELVQISFKAVSKAASSKAKKWTLEKGSKSLDALKKVSTSLKKVNSACRIAVLLKLVEKLVFERQ